MLLYNLTKINQIENIEGGGIIVAGVIRLNAEGLTSASTQLKIRRTIRRINKPNATSN